MSTTLSETERTKAIYVHDIFNIIVFSVICTLNALYFIYHTDFQLIATPAQLGDNDSAHNSFNIIYYMFSLYLFIDTCWVLLIPHCVSAASPLAIVFHHISTAGLVTMPQVDSRYEWHMSITLLLETNTLFGMCRRNVTRGTILHSFSDFMFYFTWYSLRCGLLPYLCYLFTYEYQLYSIKVGTYINVILISPILIAILTLMSFQWTYQIWKKALSKNKMIKNKLFKTSQ